MSATTIEIPAPTASPVYVFDLEGGEALFPFRTGGVKAFEKLTGRKPHHSALRRLARRSWLPLPSVVIASCRYTSERAIRWWVLACTAAANNKAAQQQTGAPLTAGESAVLARFGVGGGS